ncbi:hypothetical protein SNE40_002704 [Patella caerulea]|uniref:Uncharacterized protein n=1 Tax=Patella caerulea TaxID=87958 RepID=A0AAN8KGG8_PATCE
MRGIKLRKVRTLLFSIFSFSCFFVLLLNLMVVQLNSPENATKLNLNPGSLQRKLSQHQKLVVEDLDNSEEFKKQYQNTKVIERKPQGMKEENVPHKSNKVFYNPVQYITEKQKHNIEMDYKISQLKKLVKKKRQDFIYDYEPDINKAYIEDEDEDDEDDYDYPNSKEMDNYNKELILNNFNETKLNFLKPKLKFHEVPLVKPVELVTKSVLPITKKTHVIRNVVEDGIYWSNEVEQLIPKGKKKVFFILLIRKTVHESTFFVITSRILSIFLTEKAKK